MKTKNNHGMRLMAVTVTIMLLTALSWSTSLPVVTNNRALPAAHLWEVICIKSVKR